MKRNFVIHLDEDASKKLLAEIQEGKPFKSIDGSNIQDLGFDGVPIEGYKIEQGFPNCCPYHQGIKEQSDKWFEQFPNCCEPHKQLAQKAWFKKEDYAKRPEKIINSISYTEYFIEKKISEIDWYKEITDYMDYIFHSFGTPAIGLHIYIAGIKHFVKNCEPKNFDFSIEKRECLLEFLEAQSNPKQKEDVDFNLLCSTFQEWLKNFPDLKYFEKLKESLLGKIPINLILYGEEYNPYLGLSSYKSRTKIEFINLLVDLTKKLLSGIDTATLLQKKYITDEVKYEIDLLSERHRLKQKQLTNDYSTKEIEYLQIIEKWLSHEIDFFRELKPLLKSLENITNMFKIEKREAHGNHYLKVFLKDNSNIREVAAFIETLKSIKTANATQSKEGGIAVYPANAYTIEEAMLELEVALDSYVNKESFDPTFEIEISLSDNGYSSIVEHIYKYGQNLEKYKSLYDKFDEEGFRDFFLPHLNLISKSHTATGETFNKIGKTDILIKNNDGENIFIAECKLWKGESQLSEAIDQLLNRYVTWRDEKVALIIFNKDMKGFSDLLIKAKNAVKNHKQCKEYTGERYQTSFSYVFKHPDDKDKEIKLELIVFNCI